MINTIKQLCTKYNIDWKFIKFLFVGGLNTAFGYGVFAFFIFLKFHFAIASFLSTVLGILFNFKTTGIIVFKNHDNKLIFRFLGAYVIIYLLNILFLKIFKIMYVNMYLAGFILIFPMAVVSFILMKKFVFINNQHITDNGE
ncbi:GtrA family protein [bacterium]|nr:GtrA family protein [bacterium]